MSYTSDTLVETLTARPSKSTLRTLAYVFLLAIAFTDSLMGASIWVAYCGTLVIAYLATYLLPSTDPITPGRERMVALLVRLYSWRQRYQIAIAIAAFVAIEALDNYAGGFRLGRIFNIYMAAVFSHALIFGLRSSLLIWLLATFAVYYTEIPPEYSFKLETINDFEDVVIFMYVGLLSLASAYLFRLSSVVSARSDKS